jgi:Coenzyme PQQ synthesis protein D (PqqD)
VRWRRSPGALWRVAPGYLVLGTVDGRTLEVGGPGCDVWERLAGWVDGEELAATLARQYGASWEIVSRDVRSLLGELHAQGYVDRAG